MSCSYHGCLKDIRKSCKVCQKISYWCMIHSGIHEDETEHELLRLSEEELKSISTKNLNIQINNIILQIMNDTEKIITALKKSSKETIKNLKKTSKNIKNISELEKFRFSEERISFLIDEVEQISKDMKISKTRQIIDLEQKLEEKEKILQDVESLKRVLATLEKSEGKMVCESRKGYAYVKIQSLNKEDKLKYFWEITGERWIINNYSEVQVRGWYRKLFFSDDGKYAFFCNH